MRKAILVLTIFIWLLAGCAPRSEDGPTDGSDLTREAETDATTGVEGTGANATTEAKESEVNATIEARESEIGSSDLSYPPPLTVVHQTTVMSCSAGSCEWRYHKADGETVGVVGDSPHPLDVDFAAFGQSILLTPGTATAEVHLAAVPETATINLSFPLPPDKVTARYWDGKYRQAANDFANQGIACQVTAINPETGNYQIVIPGNKISVVTIFAEWNQERADGSVEYSFLTGPPEIFMDMKNLTNTGATVVLQNNTSSQVTYGDYFDLERYQAGGWQKMPYIIDNWGFNDIGYFLRPGAIGEWEVEWDWLYGPLESGTYRIKKEVDIELTTEFTIP